MAGLCSNIGRGTFVLGIARTTFRGSQLVATRNRTRLANSDGGVIPPRSLQRNPDPDFYSQWRDHSRDGHFLDYSDTRYGTASLPSDDTVAFGERTVDHQCLGFRPLVLEA